jgi:hypothetical protein
VPLYELKEKIQDGSLTLSDIMDAIQYEMASSFSGENVINFLFLEEASEEQIKKDKIAEINARLKNATNPAERKLIIQELKEWQLKHSS